MNIMKKIILISSLALIMMAPTSKVNSMVVAKAVEGKDITAANTFFKRLDRQSLEGRGLRELSSDEVLLMIRDGKKEL